MTANLQSTADCSGIDGTWHGLWHALRGEIKDSYTVRQSYWVVKPTGPTWLEPLRCHLASVYVSVSSSACLCPATQVSLQCQMSRWNCNGSTIWSVVDFFTRFQTSAATTAWDHVGHSTTTALDKVITSADGTQPYIRKSSSRQTAHEAAALGSAVEVTPAGHDVKLSTGC